MNEVTQIRHQDDQLPADPMVSMIERVATDPNADIDKLERMLEMKERHDAQNAKAAFSSAFARASAEFPTIPLNGKGHNNKPYATLEDITKLTRPVLSKHGLALTFSVDVGDQVVVTAKLMHEQGHSESTSMALPRDTSGSKNAVQAVGSTQKYGQRYTAQAILGLSLGMDDEDDGAGATGRETITPTQIEELRRLIEKAGVTPETVCTAAKVADLSSIAVADFQPLTKKLNATIKAKEAK
ncbi:phage related protein [Ruegeria sp. TM1040]|uniref:ERF family protein n=1 Tax=Ruegeria sp. (strain TM1040) TaxID=292414 RepID=UPI0000462662|nr:ERF family protein [Ruegeria sp. TM1040]ABF63517.1 phage related protein [Ruegeria sp. TM1040]